jgi:hypothetical protein
MGTLGRWRQLKARARMRSGQDRRDIGASAGWPPFSSGLGVTRLNNFAIHPPDFNAKGGETVMITCPWCGTNYLTFQTNCSNCGGPLLASGDKITSSIANEDIPSPPLAPRPISPKYAWRLLFADAWSIAALVFSLLGIIFSLVGAVLTLAIVTAFVGIPFLLLGLAFLGTGGGVLLWRYREAQEIVNVLREGEATRGQIVGVQENYHTSVNGRHPWVIRYQFQANGQDHQGMVTTLNQPGQQLQAGKAVYVLYLPTAPKWSSIYPHP